MSNAALVQRDLLAFVDDLRDLTVDARNDIAGDVAQYAARFSRRRTGRLAEGFRADQLNAPLGESATKRHARVINEENHASPREVKDRMLTRAALRVAAERDS